MKAYKQCQGCRSLREKSCDYQKYMYKDCPCSNCLIKGVCITACDIYEKKWASQIDKYEAYY
jgi:hypothetical protein